MVQAIEQMQDVDAVIAIVFESTTFFVCMRWPRTAIEKGWSYLLGRLSQLGSHLGIFNVGIIGEPEKWRPAGRINRSTAYVGPGSSPEIKAMVSKLLETAKADAGTETVLKNLPGNIERRAKSYEQCFDGVLFAGEGCM